MLCVSRTPAIAGRWISCSSRLLPCHSLSSPRPPSAATSPAVRPTPRSAGPCANVTGRGTVTVTAAAAAAAAAPSDPRLFAGHQLAPVSSTVIGGTPAIFGPSPLSSSIFSTATPTAGRPPCADSTSTATGKAGVPPTPNPRVYSGAAPRAVSTSLGSLPAPPTPGRISVAGKLQTSKSSNSARQSFGSVRHPMRIGVPGPWSASGSRYFSDDAIQRFQRYDSVLPSDSRVMSSASAQIPRKFWFYDRGYFGCTTTFPLFTPDAYCNEVRLVDRVPVDIPILGEVNPVLPHLLLREEGKPFCHGILLDIDRMNRLGFSLRNPLTEEDVLVDGHGRLMLKDGVPIIAKTRFSTNLDFRSTSITMKRLLLNSIPQEDRYLNLPLDFLDLCYDLENTRLEKGYPQIYPAALLPLHLRGTAYMDLYDFVTSKACPAHVRKYVITESPYRIYWQTIAEGNVILGEWFFPSRVTLTDDEDYTDFWRHVRCHRFMYRKIWDYTVDELERVIQFKTPLMMPVLYKRLWNAGRRLPNLKVHRLFTYQVIRPHSDHLIGLPGFSRF